MHVLQGYFQPMFTYHSMEFDEFPEDFTEFHDFHNIPLILHMLTSFGYEYSVYMWVREHFVVGTPGCTFLTFLHILSLTSTYFLYILAKYAKYALG